MPREPHTALDAPTPTTARPAPLLIQWFTSLFRTALVLLVLVYRATFGLWLAGHCRFHPTCSQYMLDAVDKHGPFRGFWRGLKRIVRCRPGGGCGYDPA